MHDSPFTFLTPEPMVDGELSVLLLRTVPARPELGFAPEYNFELRLPGVARPAGHVNIRIGHSEWLERYSGHIGYGVAQDYRGHHYAARAVRLVLPVFRHHGYREVWVTCNPDNVASRRTLELVGAAYVDTVDVPPAHPCHERGEFVKCRYRIEL
jgi:predicted acetyltransferase